MILIRIKTGIQWSLAFILSFLIMNGIMFVYSYDPGWVKRSGNATPGFYEPGKKIVNFVEGFGISRVDDNGYINQTADLDESGYILVLGNSQANGNNVMPADKWVSLLNDSLKRNANDKSKVYNVSRGGADFCDIVSGFSAAISEFGDADTVIIQIASTDFGVDKMKNSLVQRKYSEEMCADSMMRTLSFGQKMRNALKDYFPLVTFSLGEKITQMDLDFTNAFIYHQISNETELTNKHEETDFEEEYCRALNDMLSLLKENYDKRIIILNLPTVEIGKDGQLKCINSSTERILAQLCEEEDIIYLNMSEQYLNNYSEKNVVPYGFSNTRPGYGHLNREGNRMVAEALGEIVGERGATFSGGQR